MPKSTKSLGIIPARFASTRFPGKPLVDIHGKSMIRRVYEQVKASRLLDSVVVATDNEHIFNHVKNFQGQVVMTSPFHASGTDRCAEVAALPGFEEFDVVVNIQGDEPFVDPSQVDQLVSFLTEQTIAPIATLAKAILNVEELLNPNIVKVVFDSFGKALYFSRSPIPFIRGWDREDWLAKGHFFKHIGMYAFNTRTLIEVSRLPVGRLEGAEALEQLRWLENGYSVGVCITEKETLGIDTPDDIEKARKFL